MSNTVGVTGPGRRFLPIHRLLHGLRRLSRATLAWLLFRNRPTPLSGVTVGTFTPDIEAGADTQGGLLRVGKFA